MGTLIWLVVTTLVGSFIAHCVDWHIWIGAVIGFVVGVAVRMGGGDDALDLFD